MADADAWFDDGSLEGVWRLTDQDGSNMCFLNYVSQAHPAFMRPYEPPIRDLPANKNGFIKLISGNDEQKISEDALRLWAGALKVITEHSEQPPRMTIKINMERTDPFRQDFDAEVKRVKENILKGLQRHGAPIKALRHIKILGRTDEYEKILHIYNQHDLALDTYPYNGTTTTCNMASAGVPTLTLAGDSHRSRVSSSINTYLDGPMASFNAKSQHDYVQRALELATPTDGQFKELAEARKHDIWSRTSQPRASAI